MVIVREVWTRESMDLRRSMRAKVREIRALLRAISPFAPQSVLQFANSVLHFALKLISLAFAFELAVARYLSRPRWLRGP
jgi:hypothetical protein